MKTLKTLLFAALATVGFSFASLAATYGPNLIKNGTFTPKEGVTTEQRYTTKPNLADPYTVANPFWANLEENTWYGYLKDNSSTPTSSADTKVSWINTPTQTADKSGSGRAGKGGVLCCRVSVPEDGTYSLGFSVRNQASYSSIGKSALMTAYILPLSTAGTSSLYPSSNTIKDKIWPYLVPVTTSATGDLTNTVMCTGTSWKNATGQKELLAGDYLVLFGEWRHTAQRTTYTAVYTGFYLDDVSLRQIIPAEVTVSIASDPTKVEYSAVLNGTTPFVDGETAVEGSTIDVVATPKDGFKYMTLPEGWFEGEGGSITNSFVVPGEDFTIAIEDPVEDAQANVTFVDSEFATYSAKVGEDPIESGESIALGSLVDIVATPNDGYRYLAIPEGWEAGDEDGTIKTTVEILEKATEIAIPDPVASRQVLVTANDTVDYEVLTNEVKIASGDYVLVGEAVKVEVTPKTGYWWTEVPAGWQGEVGMGTIMNTFEVVANENLEIELPTAVEHLVMVTVVNPLEKATCQLTIGGEPIESGAKVLYGTVVTVTVTSTDPDYEYSKAPTGWTGGGATITREITIDDDTEDIVIPDTNFGKRQIAVNFVAKGVTYVATNLTTNTQLKNGGKADFDAQIRIVAAPYSGEYVFDKELPEGWSFGENGVIVGEVAAASSIEIPVAAWTPTDGELIENGGFEFFDVNAGYTPAYGFPTSMLNWKGDGTLDSRGYRGYGLWKKGDKGKDSRATAEGSAHGGTYAGCAFSRDGAKDEVLTASFTTPENSKAKSEYQLEYWTKRFMTDKGQSLAVSVLKGSSTVTNLVVETPTTSWRKDTHVIFGLEPNTSYKIKFALTVNNTSFAIDDVSLKMVQKKGLAIMLF